MSPAPAIGFQQRAGLRRLLWRPEVAPADDKVFRSLTRLDLAASVPAAGGCEWRINLAGCQALGFTFPDDDQIPDLMEQAA